MKELVNKCWMALVGVLLLVGQEKGLCAQLLPAIELSNFDQRQTDTVAATDSPALARLRAAVPDVQVQFDPILGSPRWVMSRSGFLTSPNGAGRAISAATLSQFAANDSNRVVRAFLREHHELFGHGAEALDAARIKREFINDRSGLHTTVWEQQVDGISVFDALFISHVTSKGELVSLSSHFVPAPDAAAGFNTANRAQLETATPATAAQAVQAAAANVGENISQSRLTSLAPDATPERLQSFTAPNLKGTATAHLVWLPMSRNSLRLCWEVILMSRARDQMFRVIVDAQTGQALVRHCLTSDISNASYRVFNSFNPTPFLSPSNSLPTIMGYSSPQTNQPAQVNRALVTISALDTNASPNGWINDGDNTTAGNNVLAQADRSGANPPNPFRPTGSPFRVFDFSLDLTQDPITYTNASVVNLFYWCNWMHDSLYDLGFTEAAGNFQQTNFGRGGTGGDPVMADAEDGSGINNAHFSTPPDGMSGLMQIYLFNGPTPERDGDFDDEIIMHEYTHGMSNRRVGGGVGISAPQSLGLGEGWSDFFSLALSSQSTDDPNACYPEGPYASYLLNGLTQNYYFGIRRYPYSTSLTNCPGTFADIDPSQISSHTGVPINPAVTNSAAYEIHNQGEIWCDTLWDARANLIASYGFTNGNQTILQLVASAMDLTPANPTFVEARDAIIEADFVNTGGQNYQLLWRAFAKRGLGQNAVAPPSSTTSGVVESYVVPDTLYMTPTNNFSDSGNIGGPFDGDFALYTLKNTDTNSLSWRAGINVPWATLSSAGGTLAHLVDSTNITVSMNALADLLSVGRYSGVLSVTNLNSGFVQTRNITLTVAQPTVYFFSLDSDPGWSRQGQWAFGQPTGQGGGIHGNPDPSSGETGSNVFGVNLNGNYTVADAGPFYLTTGALNFSGVTNVTLQFARWLNSDAPPYAFAEIDVSNDGTNWTSVFDNSAGVISDSTWTNCSYDISGIADNQPVVYVRWSYQITSDAFAFSGWNIDDIAFVGINQLSLTVPGSATEGDGTLPTPGNVSLPHALPSDLTVTLLASDPSTVLVPNSVTIPAGQTNATFGVTVEDDGLLDGTRPIQITASAPSCSTASATITINDAESATLSVAIQSAANEGDGTIQGTVSMTGTPAEDITVTLISSDSALVSVPTTMVIPAGQTNATFDAVVQNPNRINGSEIVTLTAHVQNWTNGNAGINVQYPQASNLSLTLPAQARENNGLLANAGLVTLPGTLSTNLVVSLVSSNTTKLLVPATVTVLAGHISAAFNLTTVSGNAPETPVTVSVSATAPGFTPASASMSIIDNQTPPAPFNPSPANSSANNPVNVTLSWSPGLGEGVETVVNGGFESGDYSGWHQSTNFVINNGTVNPPSGDGLTSPFDGSFSALAEPVFPATSLLYQDISLPTNVTTITLSWADRIRNFSTNFATNQQFRVEVRNTNNTTLATVYSSQPGDPLLNDWTQRSANISTFAGQTVRIAFIVNANVNFLDVHLDDISVRSSSPPLTTYAVYFGTDPTPGPSDFLGNTTNTYWPLPRLTPFVTYYWQIVANRSNQTAGPIWQFSSLPTLYVTNAFITNNTNGNTNLIFTVSLSDTNASVVSVAFTTVNGTAISPFDYAATNGTLTFNPGDSNQTVAVSVNFSSNAPSLRTFTLALSNPVNAALGNTNVLGTINEINPLAPVVTAISNRTIHARTTFNITVTATNTNHDPMTFSLDPGAPTNAAIGAINGQFTWTPADTDLGPHAITVRATDTSVPTLSGAATFTVNVVPRPAINSIKVSGGQATLSWTAIPTNVYQLQSRSNLILGNWTNVPGQITATNTFAIKTDTISQIGARFYRVVVLP